MTHAVDQRRRARAEEAENRGWQPIETAPKDGTRLLLWCVHANARFSKDPVGEGWAAPVIGSWIEHNGGGWCWNGLAGVHTHWAPLPGPPKGSPDDKAMPRPAPPGPIGSANDKRAGWDAFFDGKPRDSCPFPPARRDLAQGYAEGWDAAAALHQTDRPAEAAQ